MTSTCDRRPQRAVHHVAGAGVRRGRGLAITNAAVVGFDTEPLRSVLRKTRLASRSGSQQGRPSARCSRVGGPHASPISFPERRQTREPEDGLKKVFACALTRHSTDGGCHAPNGRFDAIRRRSTIRDLPVPARARVFTAVVTAVKRSAGRLKPHPVPPLSRTLRRPRPASSSARPPATGPYRGKQADQAQADPDPALPPEHHHPGTSSPGQWGTSGSEVMRTAIFTTWRPPRWLDPSAEC